MNLATMNVHTDQIVQQIIHSGKFVVTSFLTALAQTSLGQFVLGCVDWALKIVEQSAQWSLPQPEAPTTEENGKSFQTVVQKPIWPAPAFIFFPVLIALRAFRLSWDAAAFFLGYPYAEPSVIVKILQKARRRLRAIKTNGIKSMRQKRGENIRPVDKNFQEAKRSLIESIQLTLSSLSCLDSSRSSPSPPPTRIKVTANHEMSLTPDERSATESTIAPQPLESKRKYIELIGSDQETDDSEDETLNDKIDRMAAENSADDQDFDPNNCTGESSSGIEEEDEEEDENVSQDELEHLRAELIQRAAETTESITAFIEDQRNSSSSSSKPIDIKPRNDTEEQRDYYSPNEYKSGDDGEADFYSPISSKSNSPERAIVTDTVANDGHGKLKGNEEEVEQNCTEAGEQILEKSNGHGESEPAHPSTSPKRTQKQHQPKGKRMTQGNRKKK